jgi:hypothetical protein
MFLTQWFCVATAPWPLQLQVLADRNQSFVRLLGVELGPEGPQCQRFAGVVDGGILLKLVSVYFAPEYVGCVCEGKRMGGGLIMGCESWGK